MWRAGTQVKKENSTARWAGPDDLLRVLDQVKSKHIRIAIWGVWKYDTASTPYFGWLGLKMLRSQLAKRLSEMQTELALFERSPAPFDVHTKQGRKAHTAYLREQEQRLMLEMINDLFSDAQADSRALQCEKAFAWSIAKSED